MISPNTPTNEKDRLEAVRTYGFENATATKDYDAITQLVATICDAPIALIALLDKNTNNFRSHHGLDFDHAPRDISFCGHAILEDIEVFIVPDTLEDPRFVDNPHTTEDGFRFYAGVPLINPSGYKLGTLCVFDKKPRDLNETQKATLVTLANQVVNLLELHKRNDQLEAAEQELQLRNKRLEDFAGIVSHDLKSPLATITSLARLLKEEGHQFNKEASSYLDYIEESTETLKNYINGMLSYYKSSEALESAKEDFSIQEIFAELEDMLFIDSTDFKHPKDDTIIHANRSALSQILVNLIDNALKYNESDIATVSVDFSEDTEYYEFKVTDNGIGVSKEAQEVIFDLFKVTQEKDRHGKRGYGIGLATVKKLVVNLGGDIWVRSEKGEGTTFTFTIKK